VNKLAVIEYLVGASSLERGRGVLGLLPILFLFVLVWVYHQLGGAALMDRRHLGKELLEGLLPVGEALLVVLISLLDDVLELLVGILLLSVRVLQLAH